MKREAVETAVDQSCKIPLAKLDVLLVRSEMLLVKKAVVEIAVDQSWRRPRE